jgi:hypothetical protein
MRQCISPFIFTVSVIGSVRSYFSDPNSFFALPNIRRENVTGAVVGNSSARLPAVSPAA